MRSDILLKRTLTLRFLEVEAMKRWIFLSAAGVVALAEILVMIFPSGGT